MHQLVLMRQNASDHNQRHVYDTGGFLIHDHVRQPMDHKFLDDDFVGDQSLRVVQTIADWIINARLIGLIILNSLLNEHLLVFN